MNDFIDFLYQHIPHRWLDKKAKGTKKLFNGLGNSFKYAEDYINLLKRNNSTRTAVELLEELENEYGLSINPEYDIDFRRSRIIAKIRMQDCPVTKDDLIKMLEILGFYDCEIVNYLNTFTMSIKFKIPEEYSNRIAETKKLIDENIRAHIDFFIYIVICFWIKIKNNVYLHRVIFFAYVRNLKLEYICLDGRKNLDNTWRLNIKMRALKIYSFYCNIPIKTVNNLSAALTKDTMWRLNNEYCLNGEKKLNADIIKEKL